MQKLLLVLPSLVAYNQTVTAQDYKGLKDYCRDYFTVGVSVAPQSVEPGDEAELTKKNFASLTGRVHHPFCQSGTYGAGYGTGRFD